MSFSRLGDVLLKRCVKNVPELLLLRAMFRCLGCSNARRNLFERNLVINLLLEAFALHWRRLGLRQDVAQNFPDAWRMRGSLANLLRVLVDDRRRFERMIAGLGGKVPDWGRSDEFHTAEIEGRSKLVDSGTRRGLQKLHLRCGLLRIVLSKHTPESRRRTSRIPETSLRYHLLRLAGVGPLATMVFYSVSTWAVVV